MLLLVTEYFHNIYLIWKNNGKLKFGNSEKFIAHRRAHVIVHVSAHVGAQVSGAMSCPRLLHQEFLSQSYVPLYSTIEL